MAKVTLVKKHLFKALGRALRDEELLEALPAVKCGVDAVTASELEVEVTSDRPDLMSCEGVARALNGSLGKATGLPVLKLQKSNATVRVDKSVLDVRPVIVSALIHGFGKLSDDDLVDLMQQQERLHQTHGRRRRKVAIGVHDADKVEAPFTYKAVGPRDASFVPLGWKQELTLEDVLQKHEKGQAFAWILEGAKRYPLLVDKHERVLSFPPIINGALTQVAKSTQSLFIDITGTDFEACNTALNIICQDWADKGATVHSVTVQRPDGAIITPQTEVQEMRVGAAEVGKLLGVQLNSRVIADLLKKQRLGATPQADFIEVEIPRYRADFLHPVDVVEEVAIAFGLNNLRPKDPDVFTKGCKSELTYELNSYRDALAGAGYLELNTPVLTSVEKLQRAKITEKPVAIANPVSSDYGIARPSLLPCLLDVLSRNTHMPYPQKLFEAGEVLVLDSKSEARTRTEERVAAVSCHSAVGLSEIASVMNEALRRKWAVELAEEQNPALLKGRSAAVLLNGKRAGWVGELHPEVLQAFGLELPCAAFEVVVASE